MNQFLDFATEYSAQLSSIANLVIVLVWMFYTRLFYLDFRTRHYPRLMIHQAPDMDIHSVCLVVNMSQGMVNIAGILAIGYSSEGRVMTEISDYRHYASDFDPDKELKSILKQGPVASGDYIHLGTFQQILHTLSQKQEVEDQIQRLELRVIAFSGSESRPTGAYRTFIHTQDPDRTRIRPTSIETLQMSSPQQRRQVRGWIDELQSL